MKAIDFTLPSYGDMAHSYTIDTDGLIIEHVAQDVGPYLDLNKAKFNETGESRKYNRKSSFHEVAEIPNSVIYKWLKEGFNVYTCSARELKKKLNQPEWRYLKTRNVKL